MADRSDLPSILTRVLFSAASTRAREISDPDASGNLFGDRTHAAGETDLTVLSDLAHRLLSNLITLLSQELEGLVESPLNSRSRARVRLGAPSHSRILAEWESSPRETLEGDLFAADPQSSTLPIGRDPEAFFWKTLHSARATAASLEIRRAGIEEMIRWLLPVVARCDPEDDPVGWIHAHSRRHRLAFGPGHRLRFQVDRAKGRSHGVLYTPPPLAEALVQAILAAWQRRESPDTIPLFGSASGGTNGSPRILDPSCGSGQFLLAIARHLLGDKEKRPEEILGIFRGMHGVDIDPGAATLAAFNLSLQAVRFLRQSQEADARVVVQWLQDQLEPGFPWFLGTQIHKGNALYLAATDDGESFRWTDRFSEIFKGERPGFDIVIGNPPWVSYGLRDRAGPEAQESAYLRKLYTFGAQYKLSLYPMFIELALRLTRPGGYHGFLVPDSFFTGRHFSRIREHVLEASQPLLFCLVESGPWPGVHVGHTAFYCVRRLPVPGPTTPVTTCVLQLPPLARKQRKKSASSLSLFGSGGTRSNPVLIDPEILRTTPHHTFRIYREERERRFVEQLERAPLRLEDVVETYSGLIARSGQEGVMGPRKGVFRLEDRAGNQLVRDPRPARRWKSALHSGSEVEPFRVQWRGGALYIPDEYEQLRKVYKSGFDLERYARPKIFLRQTGDRIVAARDEKGLLCLNNVHVLTPREESRIDLRFFCGLLLSDPIQRYYQAIALEAGRPLAQVDLATVQTLPYPCHRDGTPHGTIPTEKELQRRGAKIAKSLLDTTTTEWSVGLVGLLQDAVAAGSKPLADHSGVAGLDFVTAVVCRLVELLESEESAPRTKEIWGLLDKAFRILFGLPPTASASSASRSGRR